jgi:hypothetical protein
MPETVSGNPNAAVVMIAEKGSDMIKSDWKSVTFSSNKLLKQEKEEL